MGDLKSRLAAAQQGSTGANQALDLILGGHSQQVLSVKLDLLAPWSDWQNKQQPFRSYSEDKLQSLMSSMERQGLLFPIITRALDNGRYQILAGHNRTEAAQRLGWTDIPAIVLRNISDDKAAEIMVDTNFCQRDVILPSERAKGWKIKLEAMSHQGTSSHDGTKLRSDTQLGASEGVGRSTIQRYVALTKLTDSLLDIVDGYQYDASGEWVLNSSKPMIPLTVAEHLTALSPPEQNMLVGYFQAGLIAKLTKGQAAELKEAHFHYVDSIPERKMEEVLGLGEVTASAPKSLSVKFELQAELNENSKKYLKDPELQLRLENTVLQYLREKGAG